MIQITTETKHEQAHIHFIHDDIEITVMNLTPSKTVSVNFNNDLHIYLRPEQAEELSELLRG
jgi:antitoxin component of MazEF toxin-antitoxin module